MKLFLAIQPLCLTFNTPNLLNNKGFIGQAGTGKTTKVMETLEALVDPSRWDESSTVLAITHMHGSRRRLDSKLITYKKRGINVDCTTIDSFCMRLLQRYKSYLGIDYIIIIGDNEEERTEIPEESKLVVGVKVLRELVLELLEFDIIMEVLKFSYPIIIIDEFQDCDEQQLGIIQKLSSNECLIIAADDFQKLDDSNDCPPVEWLRENISFEELDQVWRTSENTILSSSSAIRNNTSAETPIEIKYAPAYQFAAYLISSEMQWYSRMGASGRTLAILSPVRPSTDVFVRKTLERLREPFVNNKTYGRLSPRYFRIEDENRVTVETLISKIPDFTSKDKTERGDLELWREINDVCIRLAAQRALRLLKMRGKDSLSKTEFREILSSTLHFAKTFLLQPKDNRVFLTVHGAKNREFDDVFILWPQNTISSMGNLQLRKLMYNAITRAKRKVILIVQDRGFNIKNDTASERTSEVPLNLLTSS